MPMEAKIDKYKNFICIIPEEEIVESHGQAIFAQMFSSKGYIYVIRFVGVVLNTYLECADIDTPEYLISYSLSIQKSIDGNIIINATADGEFAEEDSTVTMTVELSYILERCNFSLNNNDLKNIKRNDINELTALTDDKGLGYDLAFYFECWSDTLENVIDFSKSIEEQDKLLDVYKDDKTGRYVVPVMTDSLTLPLNFYEYMNIVATPDYLSGVEEHRTKICSLGDLMKI